VCQIRTTVRSVAVASREQIGESPSGSSITRSRRSSDRFWSHNDGELVWAVGVTIEASRKFLDVDRLSKHRIYVGSLDGTLQDKPTSRVQGVFQPPKWAQTFKERYGPAVLGEGA
jgi:hypothetical protein